MSNFDTVVIGAGHNGLVCAIQLARSGQRVLVLEANEAVGGLAAAREFYPGFRASVAQTLYALPAKLVKEYDLESHGFTPADKPLDTIALAPNEEPIIVSEDGVSGVSLADEAAYTRYRDQLKTFSRALSPFWRKTIPGIGGNSLKEILTYAHMGLNLRMMGKDDMLEFLRVATLPMRDLVEEYFENETLKAALCWDGLIGSKLAPRSPNQAVLTLLNRMAGQHEGLHSVPGAGIGSFVAALHEAAKATGVEVRTNCAVKRVTLEADENGQRASGVELHDGSHIAATRVVSNADPRSTFFKLVGAENLEIEFANRIRRLRCDGYVAKLHLALDGLPQFTGVENPNGRILIAPSMDAIEFAYDDAKYGDCSQHPVMELLLPSLHQTGLAPTGKHLLTAQVMYIPSNKRGGWDDAARTSLTQTLMYILEQHAPGIGALTLHAELLTPQDLEHDYHLTNGAWHHAEPAIDQLLMMRPTYEAAQYSTPIPGLYLCGAGSHPGGDITGNPGRNAAKEIAA
ncbi:MAG: NAD(P)/FAD-dependent oxidoreductase [Congregibacter sp.]